MSYPFERTDAYPNSIDLDATVTPARLRFDPAHRATLDPLAEALAQSKDQHRVSTVMEQLFWTLHRLRREMPQPQWRQFAIACQQSRLADLVWQDAFTRRAHEKPRGIAGDAVMLDYIYGREELWPEPSMTRLGRMIFQFTTAAPASCGVMARRGLVAQELDNLCQRQRRPQVLSLAAGHVREASLAACFKRRQLGRFVAVDADAASLDEAKRCYAPFGVETIAATARQLMSGRLDVGRFDLIYSTGLFDYLSQRSGRRLAQRMFQLLRPGGRLIVANFLPGIRDDGYMETFMSWNLVYRTRHEMLDLTLEIPQQELGQILLNAEEHQNIVFSDRGSETIGVAGRPPTGTNPKTGAGLRESDLARPQKQRRSAGRNAGRVLRKSCRKLSRG